MVWLGTIASEQLTAFYAVSDERKQTTYAFVFWRVADNSPKNFAFSSRNPVFCTEHEGARADGAFEEAPRANPRADSLVATQMAITVRSPRSSAIFHKHNCLVIQTRPVFPRVKRNVVPLPTSASAQMRPPWREMIRCTVARPIPVPSKSSAR